MEPTKKSHLRIPPNNTEAEKALLGSIMLRPEVMFEIVDLAHTSSFYSEKHRLIFETMLDLFGKRNPTDLLTVSARLKEKNVLEEIGGNSYLSELVNSVPSAANAAYYAQIIQKKHIARNLIGAADYISSLGYDEAAELEELLDQAQKKIYEVTNIASIHKFVEMKGELDEAWERLDRLHNSGDGLRGVPTGFQQLDDLLSGFQKSDLIILAARPSVGKTALALDMARQAAVLHNIPVGIFSLEMSSQQLVDRMLASGRDKNHAVVAVTTGLLQRLDRTELEGVIAHELSHIGNRDILLMSVVVVLVGFISIISDIFLRGIAFGNRRNDSRAGGVLAIIGVVLLILSPIIATLIKFAISRRREYLADASGALLTRYPEGLARALEKISSFGVPMKAASTATAHLFISNPFGGSKASISSLFQTHPPIEERIKILRSM